MKVFKIVTSPPRYQGYQETLVVRFIFFKDCSVEVTGILPSTSPLHSTPNRFIYQQAPHILKTEVVECLTRVRILKLRED